MWRGQLWEIFAPFIKSEQSQASNGRVLETWRCPDIQGAEGGASVGRSLGGARIAPQDIGNYFCHGRHFHGRPLR